MHDGYFRIYEKVAILLGSDWQDLPNKFKSQFSTDGYLVNKNGTNCTYRNYLAACICIRKLN